jgi:ligand-binding sensor domain-containing protein
MGMACLGHPGLIEKGYWHKFLFVFPAAKKLRVLRFGIVLGLILACWAAPFCARAAWFTRTWQTDDGLPDNQVTTIAQGRDGYLWVGTFVGLARFDGFHFTRFPYTLSPSNEDEGVTELLPARDGGLWIRTRRGPIVGLGPDFLSVTSPTNALKNTRVLAMIQDQTGCLWLATQDSIWQVRNGKASRFMGYQGKMPQGSPSGFAIDSDGHLWFAKGNGAFILRNGQFEQITRTFYKVHLAALQRRVDCRWQTASQVRRRRSGAGLWIVFHSGRSLRDDGSDGRPYRGRLDWNQQWRTFPAHRFVGL